LGRPHRGRASGCSLMNVVDGRTLVEEQASSAPALTRERVVVVGGGPAGLAVGAVLKSKGVDALVLERADEIGASSKAHYDRLHHRGAPHRPIDHCKR
jgi:NADPH-dependent 2,4-dienoyl-CoA reductase/sulfur reductase-like enzyme